MNRRSILKKFGSVSIAILLYDTLYGFDQKQNFFKKKTLLLVSGWQDVNIGDIAHTPGLLHVLQTFLPDLEIILWKKSRGEEVKQLINRNFPKVKIIYGSVDQNGDVDSQEVKNAIKNADIMVHGSGPNVVGQSNLEAWIKSTDKPFGIFGTTIQTIDSDLLKLLEKASFIYTRETTSLKVLKEKGIQGNSVRFAPDATFYLDLKDEDRGKRFLKDNELEEKKYICVIPRLRYTPYHKIRKTNWSQEKINEVESTNEKYKEVDHAKMRTAIIRWVRETGNKVLVCPEMTYQVDIMDELIIDPLPADVKSSVVKRGYWLPDEAASIYARAHTVLSFECHSPIIAAANGTPMFYLRQPEDTIKGQMYYDLGFKDWVFEIDSTEGEEIGNRLMEVFNNYKKAKTKLADAMEQVDALYRNGTQRIEQLI